MTARGVKTDYRIAVLVPADRQHKLVAVGILRTARTGGQHFCVYPAYFFERVFYEQRFESQLRGVVHMLKAAAAALAEHAALGRYAVGRGLYYAHTLAVRRPALYGEHLYLGLLAVQAEGDKHRCAVLAEDRLSLRAVARCS